jgi:hypothetical protein
LITIDALLELGQHGGTHLEGARHVDAADAVGRRKRRDAGDEHDLGAPARGLLGDREAHLARGAVRDRPDPIDRLGSAAGG